MSAICSETAELETLQKSSLNLYNLHVCIRANVKVKYDILPSEMRIELHGRIYAGVPQPMAGSERVVESEFDKEI